VTKLKDLVAKLHSKDIYDNHLDQDEIADNYLIIDNINNEDEDINDEEENYEEYLNENYNENCIGCYYSKDGYCELKNQKVDIYTPICWFYRDSLTMRASSWFQDDNDDF
jgi:hypothetical protein